MSQQEFAALFDLKRGTLGAYEEGRSEPKIDTILKVSSYFNVSTDQLLTGELTVNQLLNFSTDIHDGISKEQNSNIISIPLVDNANINSLLVAAWEDSTVENATKVQVPVDSVNTIAFQYSSQINTQYSGISFLPGDILFCEAQILEINSKQSNTYVLLYMKQLLLIDGVLESGKIQSNLAQIIDAKDCEKVWKVNAKLNASYHPDNGDSIQNRLAALEREVSLLKKEDIKILNKLLVPRFVVIR